MKKVAYLIIMIFLLSCNEKLKQEKFIGNWRETKSEMKQSRLFSIYKSQSGEFWVKLDSTPLKISYQEIEKKFMTPSIKPPFEFIHTTELGGDEIITVVRDGVVYGDYKKMISY